MTPTKVSQVYQSGPTPPTSRAVAWWPVHLFVEQFTAHLGLWPMAGTLAWNELPDEDPRKLAAVVDAGQHHVLRVEIAQEAMADASKGISAAADWPGLAAALASRAAFRAANAWATRAAS
jgi:hypothetical protein